MINHFAPTLIKCKERIKIKHRFINTLYYEHNNEFQLLSFRSSFYKANNFKRNKRRKPIILLFLLLLF